MIHFNAKCFEKRVSLAFGKRLDLFKLLSYLDFYLEVFPDTYFCPFMDPFLDWYLRTLWRNIKYDINDLTWSNSGYLWIIKIRSQSKYVL